jgi:hypothetical protein
MRSGSTTKTSAATASNDRTIMSTRRIRHARVDDRREGNALAALRGGRRRRGAASIQEEVDGCLRRAPMPNRR